MPLFECPSVRCKTNNTKGNLILQLRASKFLKFQEVGSLIQHFITFYLQAGYNCECVPIVSIKMMLCRHIFTMGLQNLHYCQCFSDKSLRYIIPLCSKSSTERIRKIFCLNFCKFSGDDLLEDEFLMKN